MTPSDPEVSVSGLDVVRPLGHGQMADVFLAREPGLGRLVALKVLRPQVAADETARRRFEREARSVAALTHPGIVQVYRFGEADDGRPYLLMQYVEGRSLEERLAAEGRLSVDEARRVLVDVASALEAAHKQGIVHRDVRPANVLIEKDTGRVLLTDFGLAAVLDTGRESATRLTLTGEMIGQPRFMSPEQIRGEKVTGQADVYQVGVLAYHLLTGEGPFGDGPPARVLAAHLQQEPPELRNLNPMVDADFAALVRRCLAKEPKHRPTVADLKRKLGGEAALAAGPLGSLDLVKRRIPQLVAAAAVAGAGLLGAVDQLTDRGIIPNVSYQLALALVVHGVLATGVISWFHGARGEQRITALEIVALSVLGVSWILSNVMILGH